MKKVYILPAFLLSVSIGIGFGSEAYASPSPQVQVSVGVPVGQAGYAGLYLDDSGVMMQMNLTPGQRMQYMKIRDKHYKKWAKQARKEAKYREKARKEYLKELRKYLAPAQFVIFNEWAMGPGIGYGPAGHNPGRPLPPPPAPKHPKKHKSHSAPRPGGHMGPQVVGPQPKPMYNAPGHPDKNNGVNHGYSQPNHKDHKNINHKGKGHKGKGHNK